MSAAEFEEYKRQDGRHNRGRLTAAEKQKHSADYDLLSPQQKGAIHRMWRRRAEDADEFEMRSGCPEGAYS